MNQNKIIGGGNILITNIQRFCLHDGPGIRTTVFLKGCSIHCPWCSNPENLSHALQNYIKKDKNGQIEEAGIYGKWYNCDDLYAEVIKDKAFYKGYSANSVNYLDSLPGGVTFSGGECMLQMRELEPLLENLHAEDVHTAVETSLFTSPENLVIAIKYVNLFYVDVKIMDENVCKNVLGGKIELYKRNMETLLQSGKPVVLRLPVIGGFTDGDENRRDIIGYLKDHAVFYRNLLKIELLKEHSLGMSKYQSLIDAGSTQLCNDKEIKMPEYKGVQDSLMEKYKKEIEDMLLQTGSKISVEICKI